jgi:hypothetical protein
MNESILAYRAWISLNNRLDQLMQLYMDRDGHQWGDQYLSSLADQICDEYDGLISVLEWLEKKFES